MSVIADKFGQFTFLHIEHLTHSKGIMFFKCLFLHFLQEVTYTIGGLQHFNTGHQTIITIRGKGREGGIFFDIDNSINPESRDTFVKPPVNHLIDFLTHGRIFPV